MNELNPNYSTTRLVTREVPIIEEPPDAAFKTVLFLPEGEGRQGEGGLRTQGCFKRSLPEKPLITVITVVFNGAHTWRKLFSVSLVRRMIMWSILLLTAVQRTGRWIFNLKA